MVAIVNARASTNRVDLAGYIIALHTLIVLNFENTISVFQMPFLGKAGISSNSYVQSWKRIINSTQAPISH